MEEIDCTFYVGVVMCIVGAAACLAAAALSYWTYRKGYDLGRADERNKVPRKARRCLTSSI